MESAIAVTAAIHSHNIVNDSPKKKTNKIVIKKKHAKIYTKPNSPPTNQKEAHAKIKPTEKNALIIIIIVLKKRNHRLLTY